MTNYVTTGLPHVYVFKSVVNSTRSTRKCRSSAEFAHLPPESYKRGQRTLFNVHLTENSDESTSLQQIPSTISNSPNKNSSFQNSFTQVKT